MSNLPTSAHRIRLECQCSVCHGAGIWRSLEDPRIGITCTSCHGGGRCIVYLPRWTERQRLDGIETVRAHGHVPEMAYERWLESVVPVAGGAVEYRLENSQ
jgi:hypothetical protein